LQVGGTEQWGNITAGLDLIRRLLGSEEQAYGLCWDLITKSDGSKFGKTESGAIWLDPKKTSPYAFYQFWLNTADADAIRYLKKFTFVSLDEIEDIAKEMESAPEQRVAQKRLAEEITKLIHSQAAYDNAVRVSDALFRQDYESLAVEELLEGFHDVAKLSVSSISILDALVELQLASSKSEARRFVESGGVSVNNQKVQTLEEVLDNSSAIHGAFSIVRRGKKQYGILLFDQG
jgi:tyrosyl-tRNA synthetase